MYEHFYKTFPVREVFKITFYAPEARHIVITLSVCPSLQLTFFGKLSISLFLQKGLP